MKNKIRYVPYTLSILTPDKKQDLEFEVLAYVSCSDESDVGLSSCEVEVDIDSDYVKVLSKCDGYTEQELQEYIKEKLDNDSQFAEEKIYEQYCQYCYDEALYEAEQAELARLERYEMELGK